MEDIIQGHEEHGVGDRGREESYQAAAGNLQMEEPKICRFSKAKKKDQFEAGWVRLGYPERSTGHLKGPIIDGRSHSLPETSKASS